jgi:hypothetical protein
MRSDSLAKNGSWQKVIVKPFVERIFPSIFKSFKMICNYYLEKLWAIFEPAYKGRSRSRGSQRLIRSRIQVRLFQNDAFITQQVIVAWHWSYSGDNFAISCYGLEVCSKPCTLLYCICSKIFILFQVPNRKVTLQEIVK